MRNNISKEVRELVTKYPNNMELGKKIRQLISDKNDEWRINQFNRNRAPEDWVNTIEEMENYIENR
jgi:hypothetical protein